MTRFFFIAGEASGDVLAAAIMRALRDQDPDASFAGIGGPAMAGAGLDSLVPFDDLAVMGLMEVLPRVPRLWRHRRTCLRAIEKLKPSVVITVDLPGFNISLARQSKGQRCCPWIHCVAPTVWAWRPGRAKRIAPLFDHLLTLLPFEPPYFQKHGLPATFCGHPILTSGADQGDEARFRARYKIDRDILLILPGSRRQEVNRMFPIFYRAYQTLKQQNLSLHPVMVLSPQRFEDVRSQIENLAAHDLTIITDPDEKYDAFAAGQGAFATSGTVTLELAMAGVPCVVGFCLHSLTYRIVRPMVKVQWGSLVNILCEREVIPEFLQKQCTPDNLVKAMQRLWSDKDNPQQIFYSKAIGKLRPKGEGRGDPATIAAQVIGQVSRSHA
ncbi:MAG: lipid-A-disaccharide synthase [Pseudomonadota bacterium]